MRWAVTASGARSKREKRGSILPAKVQYNEGLEKKERRVCLPASTKYYEMRGEKGVKEVEQEQDDRE